MDDVLMVECFQVQSFFRKLQEKTLKIPEPEQLQSTEDKMPFVFVAHDAFPSWII
jgi:hypothetical protein